MSTPTPRTDANESITCKEGDPCIAPDFARQLERERNELLEALENIMPYIEGDTKVPWKPALAAITKAKGKL